MDKSFQSEVAKIAIPVALQSMLQSSFSMIDQIMVGQLGEKSIAAVEIAAKPSFIYAFVIGAVGTIAGIMISQYIGKKDIPAEEKSVCVNTLIMLIVGLLFMAISGLFARPFIALFTEDSLVITEGTHYLQLIGLTYIPLGISNICGVAIRCRGRSSWPLYVGALSAGINTLFNYCLIFGNFGMPKLGVRGAAIASVISQLVGALISLLLLFRLYKNMHISIRLGRDGYIQYFAMLLPVVVNEFLWSVGQSINTFVYGHIGTKELAGMSLTGSVQGLTIGAMSGLAQAAGILIGKRLGEREYKKAYEEVDYLGGAAPYGGKGCSAYVLADDDRIDSVVELLHNGPGCYREEEYYKFFKYAALGKVVGPCPGRSAVHRIIISLKDLLYACHQHAVLLSEVF